MTAKTSSTCTNTAEGVMLGFGSPSVSGFDQTALSATGTITVTMNAGPITAGTKGLIRIQCLNPNAGTTIAIGPLTVTDGSTTVQVSGSLLSATSAGVEIDLFKEFVCPINATSIAYTATLGGSPTTGTFNTEVFANP